MFALQVGLMFMIRLLTFALSDLVNKIRNNLCTPYGDLKMI